MMGGVIGAVLTAAVLVFATPQFLSRSIVRQGMLADPQILVEASDALRDRQTAPLIASSRQNSSAISRGRDGSARRELPSSSWAIEC